MFTRATRDKQKDLWRLFGETARKSNQESRNIKAGMSDLLGLYGLLRHFVKVRNPADDRVAAELHVFSLSCWLSPWSLQRSVGISHCESWASR